MGEKVFHFGFLSSIASTSLSPWYATVSNNQLITFTDSGGIQRNVNSLTIWANATALYIQINESGYCVYIPANGSISIDYLLIHEIRVMHNSPVDLRYAASFY